MKETCNQCQGLNELRFPQEDFPCSADSITALAHTKVNKEPLTVQNLKIGETQLPSPIRHFASIFSMENLTLMMLQVHVTGVSQGS